MKIIYEINEQQIQPPVNQREVEVELNFDVDDPNAAGTVSINNWDFSVLEATIINAHIDAGLTGGVGIYEGLPFRVAVEDDNGRSTILDAYLDTADPEAIFECDRVNVPSKLKGQIDWLNDIADTVTYSLLFEKDIITSADNISTPYVIVSIPNRQDIAMLTLSGFVIVSQIKTTIKDLLEFPVDFTGVASAIRTIVKIALYIIFLTTLIIALVKLIKDLIAAIIQPVKYHSSMKIRTLLDKGAEHLGMTFESGVFDDDDFWNETIYLPPKYKSFPDPDGKLFGSKKPIPEVQTGYYERTFGELLRAMKTHFNGKLIAVDNVIRLERRDKNTSEENYTLPNVEQRIKRTNANEIKSTTNLRYAVDLTETNTIDNYEGTVTSVVTQPIATTNKDMVLLRGLNTVEIPFARGTRKETLTAPEKFFDEILKIVGPSLDSMTKTIKKVSKNSPLGNVTITNLINKRIGMLSLSEDYFTTGKLIGMDISTLPAETKVHVDNATKINTSYIYDNFYKVDSFVKSTEFPNADQWIRYESEVPFCKEDFLQVSKNNLIFDTLGNVGKIESLRWNVYGQRATINFRINKLFTDNLEETKDTPDGQ